MSRAVRGVPCRCDRIDLDENGVLRRTFAHERGDGGIAGIAAVPIRLAVDLYGLKHGREACRSEQDVRRYGVVAKHMAAPGMDIGGRDEQLDRRARKPLEVDAMRENGAQRVGVHRVQLIGREHARHQIHGDESRGIIERPTSKQHIERRALEGAQLGGLRHFPPERLQAGAGAIGAVRGITIDHDGAVHGSGRGARDTIEAKPVLLQQAVEHAPGEGAMRAAALQREVDENGVAACHVAHLEGFTGDDDALGLKQPESAVGVDRQTVDIEGRVHVVGDFHHRRRRGDDAQAGDMADPVDMAMAVHQDGATRQRLEAAHEPIAVDQRRADPLRQRFGGPWIFDDVVVQRDHPARMRIFGTRDVDAAHLLGRHHAQRIGEGEMRVGV